MIDIFIKFLPFFIISLGSVASMWGVYWWLIIRQPQLDRERVFQRKLIVFSFSLIAFFICALALPVSEESRNRLIGLLGLLLSVMIAFSSTTIVSNFMAGILLRITKPFRIGDFIRVGEYFGRVSERGFFDTEMQTENREFLALPNAYLINNPVTTVRNSGTVVSTSLSLGYETHHSLIESLLIKAAKEAELKDPFVHIMNLGDFSVTYRISGFLEDPKWLLSVRSHLNRCVLDVLHGGGIEIMSPTYMNQRQLNPANQVIPKGQPIIHPEHEEVTAEEIVFDKADRAARIDDAKDRLKEKLHKLESELKVADEADQAAIRSKLQNTQRHLTALGEVEEALKRD